MKKAELVCIIDDDPTFIFTTKKAMKAYGFCDDFLVFHNGNEAYDELKVLTQSGGKLPDIILLDINMPLWNGWEFLEEFLKVPHKPPIRIYIVTSSINVSDMKKAKTYPAIKDFLVKPISKDVFISIME